MEESEGTLLLLDSLTADSACGNPFATGLPPTADSVASKSGMPFGVALSEQGERGDNRPYSMRNDNALTILLLLSFILTVVAVARSKQTIVRDVKHFFRGSREDDRDFQFRLSRFFSLMALLNCVMLAVSTGAFAEQLPFYDVAMAETQFEGSQMLVVGILFLLFIAYFLVKWMAYSVVNSVFFGNKKSLQWSQAFVVVTALEGILIIPLVLLLIYFDLSVKSALIYFISVLFLNKILSIYKGWNIFFRQNGRYLQFFLYFCALEIAPLLAFGGLWLEVVNFLRINF